MEGMLLDYGKPCISSWRIYIADEKTDDWVGKTWCIEKIVAFEEIDNRGNAQKPGCWKFKLNSVIT